MDSGIIQSKSWPEFSNHTLIQQSITINKFISGPLHSETHTHLMGQDKLVFCISLPDR